MISEIVVFRHRQVGISFPRVFSLAVVPFATPRVLTAMHLKLCSDSKNTTMPVNEKSMDNSRHKKQGQRE